MFDAEMLLQAAESSIVFSASLFFAGKALHDLGVESSFSSGFSGKIVLNLFIKDFL